MPRSLLQQKNINGWVDPNFKGNVSIEGNLSVGGTLAVTGNSNLSTTTISGLTVTGNSNLNGPASLGSTLSVTGATSLSSTLSVTGAVSLLSTLSVTGLASFSSTNTSSTTTTNNLTVTGTADFSSTENYLVKRWVSDIITEASFLPGTPQVISISPAIPTGVFVGGYVITLIDTLSGNAGTTGLNLAVGIATDLDAYLLNINIFGTAGRKENLPGIFIGGLRLGDSIVGNFNATGGAPDLAHITQMRVAVVLYYIPATAET